MDFDQLLQAAGMMMTWDMPLWVVGGLFIGIFLGAIPGVSGVLAITLLLGPSYYMPALQAIIFFTAIYTGSVYGGGITAVLMNIPGTPAAIATGFDGYAMTQSGRHNEALGASIFSSAVGVFLSYFVVLLLFLPLGRVVLKFGPAEMLMVVIFALTSVGMVKGEILQTVLLGLFGILVGTIGSSPYGHARGTFGFPALFEGIPIVPALLGLLAVSELFIMVEQKYIIKTGDRPRQSVREIVRGMGLVLHHPKNLIRSCLIGLGIGLMPAAGSTIASMVSYAAARRASNHPERFGKGELDGVIAAEASNNGSEGGAVATMMLLGIPGSVTTALLIAAFMIHGMSPGPYLIRENLTFAYAVILNQFIQAGLLLVIATLFVNYFSRIIFIPTRILAPAVLVFSVVGALSARGLILDAVIMVLFAALGYTLKKLDYPYMGFILGFILGDVVDREFLKSFLMYADDLPDLFSRPAFLVMFVLTVLSIVWPYFYARFQKPKG
ncbi:MAG: tripartite tricarboxylate transporter permease [Desulfobacterales bacterium]|jgi:putative tricarboxylic transport membrane protein|nr:tripartite tricarboxylate transporter permease [Desulfobacterales bacterium]